MKKTMLALLCATMIMSSCGVQAENAQVVDLIVFARKTKNM